MWIAQELSWTGPNRTPWTETLLARHSYEEILLGLLKLIESEGSPRGHVVISEVDAPNFGWYTHLLPENKQ